MKQPKSGAKPPERRPKTIEAQENECCALAYDLARQQLADGTASSQVITHFLKLCSSEERIRKRLLEEQTKLATAKADAYTANAKSDETYLEAIKAFRTYNGYPGEIEHGSSNEDLY